MTIKQKLDKNKDIILKSNYPASKASEIANTVRIDLVIDWLMNNGICFYPNNL